MKQIVTTDIILPLEASENQEVWRKKLARKLKVHPRQILDMRLRKHSIDARKKELKVNLRIEVGLGQTLPPEPEYRADYPQVPDQARQVIIVGCGPAGMFAALKAIELGWKPVVLERGKDVSARRFDLAPIMRHGKVIEDSNYCFGEGGAGTFSDGKLYTRATKRGPVRDVYETFVAHGAPRKILTDAHPHIGSNLLPNVVKAIRHSILSAGGEVHFGAKVTEFLRTLDSGKVRGVATADGREFLGEAVILATGHSARDIYRKLAEEQVLMEQKTFAVGVRIEHPQPLIDSIQYHYRRGTERPRILPAARYRLACKIGGRGVHSFCMCPGGFIVPAATENDEVVVNGMSLARRDSPFANSGLVVSVDPEDTRSFDAEHGILSGIAFQKEMEVLASRLGGGMQKAPGQRVSDFLDHKLSDSLPDTSYFPGVTSVPLHQEMPAFISTRMQTGLKKFGREMKGYVTEEAGLLGFETRTSSPLRIPREDGHLQHPEWLGLYPCGEGAGYAGGIISAALDGMKCAQAACG
ncbi:FAD-binding protein [Verrucomicrobiaceae bacterium N1E253]|uniref:FAD-binding protein n=1 Tax=Oceaniferula marina TaxID=2748318 RepID=A0A851GG17_9BACT|nr:FAD-dependent oxidoreductase [Oceaniferula marina]NWK54107.1 FAD-binding protein [Oceaniferula marina]